MARLGQGRERTSSPICIWLPISEVPSSTPQGTDSPTLSSGLFKALDHNIRISGDSEVVRLSRRAIDRSPLALASDVVWMDPCRQVHPCLTLRLVSSFGPLL
jgi:hypothetical protein